MVIIRKAMANEWKDFVELMLVSAPYFSILFGKKVETILQGLFCYRSNLFSFEHVHFAELDGKIAGMILGYDWKIKKQENLMTGFLLLKKIGVGILRKLSPLIKFNATVGKLHSGEFYVSNIAVKPKYRGMEVGKRIMFEAEHEAKMAGAERIVLDVEKDNVVAITLYKKMGYEVIKEFSIPLRKDKILNFYRLTKKVK